MVPIDRKELVILMEAGYIYLGLGRFDEASDLFEGVAALDSKSEVPWVALGTVRFATKKFQQAVQMYQRALKIKSESPYARVYLGEALFFQGKKEEAIRELEKASLLDPSGAAGDFAKTLLKSIRDGFTPPGSVKSH